MRFRLAAARLVAFAALVLAALAVVLVVRGSVTADDARSTAVAPCRTLALDEVRSRVTCSTPSARLTIAAEGTPLPLGDTEARVLGARLDGRTVVVRLRLRRPGTLRRARVGPGQVYLDVGGRRIPHARLFGGGAGGGEGEAITVTLRFRLPRALARRLRRGDARGDLAVVPYEHVGQERPPRLGIVRLELP